MTHIFDGVGDILNGVFGGTVTVTPQGGMAREVQAIFRGEGEAPVMTEDGVETLSTFPVLSAPREDVDDLVPGGRVEPGNGKAYLCLAQMDGGSPDPRGLTTIQLEEQ